jgi:transcriptional regulator with AAA-type ATPase domain
LMATCGTIGLVTKHDFQESRDYFQKLNYLDCGLKKGDIELFRALKLHAKKDQDRPRRVYFNTDDPGAFKRGLKSLLHERYGSSDPACLIVINRDVFSSVMKDLMNPKRPKNNKGDNEDPIKKLITETEKNPVVKEIGKVYIGNSFAMRFARAMILKAAQSATPVLILGETGTGKDVIAHQIYKYAAHNKKGFLTINCSTLQDTLLESELFGHTKGSFTGATANKDGAFVALDGGTLFLDEIGELSLANQAKLLMAVDKQEIRSIGSNKAIKVNVRILAATNRNIDAMVLQGRFREDLHHRLNFFRIYAPPLRRHPDDIPAIANFFWEKQKVHHKLTPAFLNFLKSYSWPGNVRELKAMLSSIIDIFGDVPPTRKVVDAIRSMHQETLNQSINQTKEGTDGLFILEARNRLISMQNIMRGIKIRLRPVLGHEWKGKAKKEESLQLKSFISEQIRTMDELFLQPIYFIDWELFQKMTRYRHILEKTVNKWPDEAEGLLAVWDSDLKELDEFINRGILDIIWEKITVLNQKSR